jgi:CheY-like chemotaxis protein
MAKILIIEDDLTMVRHLVDIFWAQDYETQSAGDGEEGLAKAKAFHPDVITLDILMPVMNGFEVLDRLKADPETKDIPVVIISCLDNEKDIETGFSKGASKYLPKSQYNPQDLINNLEEILS